MCVFCKKMSPKLTRHIKLCHKDTPRIKNALKLNKKSMQNEFLKIRREGIVMYNRTEAANDKPNFQGERVRKKYFELKKCSCCNAFISKRFFANHRKICSKQYGELPVALPIEQNLPQDLKLSDSFLQSVVSKIRSDNIGNICRTDKAILLIGSQLYKKLSIKREKVATVNKSIRSDMRIVASLYSSFLSMEGITTQENNSIDMFLRINFEYLCDAIDEITVKEDKSF